MESIESKKLSMGISTAIINLISTAKIPQKEIAKILGKSESNISRQFKNEYPLSLDDIGLLAGKLELPIVSTVIKAFLEKVEFGQQERNDLIEMIRIDEAGQDRLEELEGIN